MRNSYPYKIRGIKPRIRKNGLPIYEKITDNGFYIAINFQTNDRIGVYCNPKGSAGNWNDVPESQNLSILKGKGRDKYLNKKSFTDVYEAINEFVLLEEELLKLNTGD